MFIRVQLAEFGNLLRVTMSLKRLYGLIGEVVDMHGNPVDVTFRVPGSYLAIDADRNHFVAAARLDNILVHFDVPFPDDDFLVTGDEDLVMQLFYEFGIATGECERLGNLVGQ